MKIGFDSFDNKIVADWDDKPLATKLSGELATRTMKRHFWKASILSANDFSILRSYKGKVVQLETTDYADRNSEKVYIAEVKNVTGDQVSINVQNVQAEFYIRQV